MRLRNLIAIVTVAIGAALLVPAVQAGGSCCGGEAKAKTAAAGCHCGSCGKCKEKAASTNTTATASSEVKPATAAE